MRDRPPSRQTLRRDQPADGSPTVFVVDDQVDDAQRRLPVDVARWERLATDVLCAEGVGPDAEVSVLYVDEPAMADLNGRFMGGDGPTDVLAFPIDDEADAGTGPEGSPLLIGDVVICPVVAERNAAGHAGSYDDELALLLVHGLLHLLGHDHALDDDRHRMRSRERDLLARFHGPLSADPWAQ
jgi:probable rRNA maturation factor